MTPIWAESLARNFDEALNLMAAAIHACPDELWESSMWAVPADLFGAGPPGPDGQPVTDPAPRHALVQRRSTPWSVAWHALEVLDYDLSGEFEPWEPPPPFAGNSHWLLTRLPEPWSKTVMLGYINHCRQRVRDTLAAMTDEKASTLLPETHRYAGQPHAWLITNALAHTVEHAAQIRQFITDSGR